MPCIAYWNSLIVASRKRQEAARRGTMRDDLLGEDDGPDGEEEEGFGEIMITQVGAVLETIKVIRKFFLNNNKSFRWHLGDYAEHVKNRFL